MKKIIISFIFIALIISLIVIWRNSDKTSSSNSEGNLETALIKSMEETKKENEKIEELLNKIPQELNDKGYGQIGLSFSPNERILTVQVKDKEFVKKNKSNIENIILNSAKKINFQNFEVDFITLESYKISQEDTKLNESVNEVAKLTSDLLKENGYNTSNVSIDPRKEMIIEVTNGDLKKNNETEKLIANSIFSKTNMNFKVLIKEKSKSQIRDQEWQPIFSAIREETEKEFEEYQGFAYSFHPEPLQIIIKTDLEKPKWFWQSNKKVKQITNYVDKIIELKRGELSIEEIPYEIIIRDKDSKKIN